MFQITNIALAPLNTLINTALQLDLEKLEQLTPLAGKVLAVEWRAFNITLFVYIHIQGVRLSFDYTGTPDTTLSSSTPLAFVRLLTQPEIKSPTSDISLQGDPHLAQQIQNIFANLSIDWEEQLSKLVGDGGAYHVSKTVLQLKNWVNGLHQDMQINTTEFLQQETAQLPTRGAVEDFLREVDHLRNDVERAAIRIKYLSESLA